MKILNFSILTSTLLFTLEGAAHQQEKIAEITIGVPEFDPYFIKKPVSGLFIQIINELFKNANLPKHSFEFLPFLRVSKNFENGKINTAANIFVPNPKSRGHLSGDVFYYRDCFFSLKSNNFNPKSLKDLYPYTVGAYSGAKHFQDPKYSNAVDHFKNYKEIKKIGTIPSLIKYNRIQFGFIDMFIFFERIKKDTKSKNSYSLYDSFCFLPWGASHMSFSNPQYRDKFNQALNEMKESGRFLELYRNHLVTYVPDNVLDKILDEFVHILNK